MNSTWLTDMRLYVRIAVLFEESDVAEFVISQTTAKSVRSATKF